MHRVDPSAVPRRRRLGWLGLAAALAVLALPPLLLLDRSPAVTPDTEPDALQLAALRHTLRAQDPRRLSPGSLHEVHLRAIELQVLADHLLRPFGGAARLALAEGRLDVDASLPLPLGRTTGDAAPRAWLNLRARLADGDGMPPVTALRIGELPVPAAFATWAIDRVIAHLDRSAPAGSPPLQSALREVRWSTGGAEARFEWRPDLPKRVLGGLLPPGQTERMLAQQARLSALVGSGRGAVPLPALLQSAFALAAERSRAPGADAAAENRAALLTLALYVIGRSPSGVLPGAAPWPRARWRPVLARGRIDFPQHFLVSASLAAEAGGPLADAIGLAKEVSDARRGSGFSFNDLAVNLAGARLGEAAVHDPDRLQARLAAGVPVDALVPEVADLPEFLSEGAFRERYGEVGSPTYLRLLAEIEARVAALPLWRGGGA